jgi:hypothetical protein
VETGSLASQTQLIAGTWTKSVVRNSNVDDDDLLIVLTETKTMNDTLTFLEYSAEDLEQQSMDDLTFGRLMSKGYITAKDKIDKTVWTARFFALVKSEVDNYVGLHKLTWSVKFGTYARDTLIMCSRKVRGP